MPRPRRAKKVFTPGQRIEIQREVGTPWEPGLYEGTDEDMKGWHRVRLDQPWFIDLRTGMATTRELGALTTFKLVPTQRIRASTPVPEP